MSSLDIHLHFAFDCGFAGFAVCQNFWAQRSAKIRQFSISLFLIKAILSPEVGLNGNELLLNVIKFIKQKSESSLNLDISGVL